MLALLGKAVVLGFINEALKGPRWRAKTDMLPRGVPARILPRCRGSATCGVELGEPSRDHAIMVREGQRMLKIGCCGFPRARREMFRHFAAVEVQQTFYEPPRPKTLAGWRLEAPEDFEFTLKAWQLITHPAGSPTYRRLRTPLARPEEAGYFRPTPTVNAAWARTSAAAQALGAKVILFQCPARFVPQEENIANLRSFFRSVARDDLVFTWEPRGPWPDQLVRALCRELELVHAVDPLQRRPLAGRLVYFRLHGIGGYHYRYTDGDLERLLALCPRRKPTYCLFNNTTMFDDARRFQRLIAGTSHRVATVS
jgi:uncharacterized protein YecE (DUF72 family)